MGVRRRKRSMTEMSFSQSTGLRKRWSASIGCTVSPIAESTTTGIFLSLEALFIRTSSMPGLKRLNHSKLIAGSVAAYLLLQLENLIS